MRMRRPTKNNRGFTLLELMVTVTVLAIITTIGIIGSQGMRQGFAARAAARQVYSDLQMARLRAIKEGKEAKLDFVGTTGSYNLDVGGPIIKSVDLRANFPDIRVCDAANEIVLYPNGTTSGGRIIFSIGESTKRVYITTGTGNVRITNKDSDDNPLSPCS